MNILIYRYGSICEPDIIETFHKLGFQVDEETSLIKNKTLSDNDCIQIVSERILQNQYAFVFTINFFPWLSHLCNLTHLPYLSLIVDSPVLELYDNAIKNPCNRIFMFDKASYLEFYDKNPNCIFHLPLAANVTRTNKLFNTTASELKKKYEADISFIGSTYQEKCAFNQIKLPEYESGYAMGIIEAQLKVYGYNFIEEILSNNFVQKFMKCAQNIDVAANEIPIYRAIVAQHFLSVSLRIFDVLGCGGFLITNFQSELPDYFEIGKDLVTYESPQDLLDKCSYYLKHEDERIEIANNGYEKVKQFHTWDIRLVQLLQLAFPDIMN